MHLKTKEEFRKDRDILTFANARETNIESLSTSVIIIFVLLNLY